jgi:DNA-binding XRE family transcriptional regulator
MAHTKNTSPEEDSPVARGLRFKKARKMTSLSSEQMAEELGYSRQTVSYWENGVNGGLTQKGAVKAVYLFKKHDIQCDIGWLLYGLGDITLLRSEKSNSTQIDKQEKKSLSNAQRSSEIDLFLQTHSNAVFTQLKHSFMQPFFDNEDWVGGCFLPMRAELVGLNCIVKLKNHYEVRLIKKGSKKGKYDLILTSPSSDPKHPFELTNVQLMEAAPIIRVWKKQPLL